MRYLLYLVKLNVRKFESYNVWNKKRKVRLNFFLLKKNILDKKIFLCIFYRMIRKIIKLERLKELVNFYYVNVSEINYVVR